MGNEIDDVFISYNSADEEIAQKMGQTLENEKIGTRNIKVFFAPWDIKKGENFIAKIDEALAKARFFVIVLSPEALDAEWPTAERAAALLNDPSGRLGRVIPVLVRPCKVPPLLAIRNWVDIKDKSRYKSEMTKLVYTIKGEPLPRGNPTPGSPVVNESGPSPLIQISSSSEPDKIDELIHSNLFPVIKMPTIIWKSPTDYWEKSAVYRNLGSDIPPFILREKNLFTFSSLNDPNNKLRFVIDKQKIESINIEKWFSDEDKSRWIIDLLSSETKRFCKNLGLFFDKTGKQFYGDSRKIKNETFSWTPHVRKGRRGLIIPYSKVNEETGVETTYFYRHRAVSLRFILLGKEMFLQIDPGWEYSTNGSILITGKKRSVLNTRLKSRLKNDVEFDEMRFWAWILSDGKKITMGSDDSKIEIDVKPLSFRTSSGIYGDKKPIPDVVDEPPNLVEEEEEEIAIEEELEEVENGESEEEGEENDI